MAFSYGATMVPRLNAKFNDKTKVQQEAIKFQNKHGPKGKGGNGKKPYKFGNYADDQTANSEEQAKWLIDTGTRNWDNSLRQLEDTIRKNLSDDGHQVPMEFSILPDGGNKARAEITPVNDSSGNLVKYTIILHCRT